MTAHPEHSASPPPLDTSCSSAWATCAGGGPGRRVHAQRGLGGGGTRGAHPAGALQEHCGGMLRWPDRSPACGGGAGPSASLACAARPASVPSSLRTPPQQAEPDAEREAEAVPPMKGDQFIHKAEQGGIGFGAGCSCMCVRQAAAVRGARPTSPPGAAGSPSSAALCEPLHPHVLPSPQASAPRRRVSPSLQVGTAALMCTGVVRRCSTLLAAAKSRRPHCILPGSNCV